MGGIGAAVVCALAMTLTILPVGVMSNVLGVVGAARNATANPNDRYGLVPLSFDGLELRL